MTQTVVPGDMAQGTVVPAAAPTGSKAVMSAFADLLRDIPAAIIASLLLLAYSLSYAAILFQGELEGGVPQALWALLVAGSIVGIWVGLSTSLPPLALAMDTPAMAVLVVLAASVAEAIHAAGGTPEQGVVNVMLAVWLTTVLSSLTIWLLGIFRLGQLFRFVPYPVVGGFLAATGILLLVGGVSLVVGHRMTMENALEPLSTAVRVRFAVAAILAITLVVLRSYIKSSLLVPLVFVLSCLIVKGLWLVAPLPGPQGDWYLKGLDQMRPWSPLQTLQNPLVNWQLLISQIPQMLAITAVVLISNVVKLSGLEVTRASAADLDREFRANGMGNLVSAAVGGLATSFIVSISRLLTEAGARTRWAGIFAATIVGLVVVFKLDLASVAPVPVLAGLVMFLGAMLTMDSLKRPYAQRAWRDLALCVAIAAICVRYGYIPGVLAGFVISCLLFAYSYGRLGLIRRHATRMAISSNVERALEAAMFLRTKGDAIHIYWVSGYMFFGSSDRLFEEVRRTTETQTERPVRFVVLDCGGVTGADASAVMSLLKLKNYCDKRRISLAFSGLNPDMRALLDRDQFFSAKSRHHVFATRNEALAWCESEMLKDQGAQAVANSDDFPAWLAIHLAPYVTPEQIVRYFERKAVPKGTELYHQGDPAETIDFVAAGSVAIMLRQGDQQLRMRTMATRTVLGEMGFFRHMARAASVVADEESVIFTLTRDSFERMRTENPHLSTQLMAFIVRTLADRVDFANKEIAALV